MSDQQSREDHNSLLAAGFLNSRQLSQENIAKITPAEPGEQRRLGCDTVSRESPDTGTRG